MKKEGRCSAVQSLATMGHWCLEENQDNKNHQSQLLDKAAGAKSQKRNKPKYQHRYGENKRNLFYSREIQNLRK